MGPCRRAWRLPLRAPSQARASQQYSPDACRQVGGFRHVCTQGLSAGAPTRMSIQAMHPRSPAGLARCPRWARPWFLTCVLQAVWVHPSVGAWLDPSVGAWLQYGVACGTPCVPTSHWTPFGGPARPQEPFGAKVTAQWTGRKRPTAHCWVASICCADVRFSWNPPHPAQTPHTRTSST